MKIIPAILCFALSFNCFGQERTIEDVYELPIPRNLEQCFPLLDRTLTAGELNAVKNSQEDSIATHDEFKNGTDFFHAWQLYEGSRLTKYFNKLGLTGTQEIYETILISYHRHLNNKPVDLAEQIDKHQAQQQRDYKAYVEQTQLDSINGNYIPVNLEDCFRTLSNILSEEDVDAIKNFESRTETIKLHHGLGTWLRNNWGLWGGSRIQKYMLDKGLTHPDNMSAKILEFYFDWLNNEHDGWREFEAQ